MILGPVEWFWDQLNDFGTSWMILGTVELFYMQASYIFFNGFTSNSNQWKESEDSNIKPVTVKEV